MKKTPKWTGYPEFWVCIDKNGTNAIVVLSKTESEFCWSWGEWQSHVSKTWPRKILAKCGFRRIAVLK